MNPLVRPQRFTLFFALLLALPLVCRAASAQPTEGREGRSPFVSVEVAGTVFDVDSPEYMARFRDEAASVVEAHWAPIAAAAGAPSGARVEVAVEEDIAQWFERRGVPPRNPEWAAGLALLDRDVILIRTANPEWESTLRHELAHIAVGLASGGQRVPVWFHEGFAIATAEQWSLERAGTMIRAGLSGNIHPFAELRDRFPPTSSSADLAYAQSFHFVRFIRQNYGEHVFRDILSDVREGMAWSAAFEARVGRPESVVVADWERYVKGRYKWAPATLGGGGAWGLAAGLMLVGWRRSKRRSKARLEELEAREKQVYASDPDDSIFG